MSMANSIADSQLASQAKTYETLRLQADEYFQDLLEYENALIRYTKTPEEAPREPTRLLNEVTRWTLDTLEQEAVIKQANSLRQLWWNGNEDLTQLPSIQKLRALL